MQRKMSEDNLTAVLYGIEDLRLEQRPVPQISENEVLLKMDCVGICGSDVHYLVNGRIADFILKEPMIIGHESSGVIVQVGSNVKHLKIGDRCAIEPGIPCRMCIHCRTGKYNLCTDIQFCATPPVDGNLTRFYKHAADYCFKLPDHVSMEEGALLEPLSVGVHACRRAGITLGSTVLILGAGPVGLLTLMVAKSMGATYVIITDLVPKRLQLAKQLGADHTVLMTKNDDPTTLAKDLEQTMGFRPSVSIDCCGSENTIRLAMLITLSGGCIVLVGWCPNEVTVPLTAALSREIDIRGVLRYTNAYPAALALIASGKINVKPLITHHFDITETDKAFQTARNSASGAIKVMIHVQPLNTNNNI